MPAIPKTPDHKKRKTTQCETAEEYYDRAKRKRVNNRATREFFPRPLKLDSKIEKPTFEERLDKAERKVAAAKDRDYANVKPTIVSFKPNKA